VGAAEHNGSSYDRHELLGHRLAGGKKAINDAIAASKEVEEDLYQVVNTQMRRHVSIRQTYCPAG
jgi:hypothetical protein